MSTHLACAVPRNTRAALACISLIAAIALVAVPASADDPAGEVAGSKLPPPDAIPAAVGPIYEVGSLVDDILALVNQYYAPDRAQQPHQIVYTTAHQEAKLIRGRTMAQTPQQAVNLTMITPEDCQAYAQGAPVLRRMRFVRWLYEAQAQGGLLTTADLAFLSGLSRALVENALREHERTTGRLLPLRGTVHDASSKLTHKARIVQLYLDGRLPTEIARATDHSVEAVEHYLCDFELVRELWPRYDVQRIARLTRRGPQVVKQYIQLLHHPPPHGEGDTPVREPSASPLSGSHEPAKETVPAPPKKRNHQRALPPPPRDGLPEVSPLRGGGNDIPKVK